MKPLINEAKNTILIVLGIFSAAMVLKGFLLSSHFIDGGVTGVSIAFGAGAWTAAGNSDFRD